MSHTMMSEKISSDNRLVKELYAPARRNFLRRRIVCGLLVASGFSRHASLHAIQQRLPLHSPTIIDVLSKHAWAVPLKAKSGNDVAVRDKLI